MVLWAGLNQQVWIPYWIPPVISEVRLSPIIKTSFLEGLAHLSKSDVKISGFRFGRTHLLRDKYLFNIRMDDRVYQPGPLNLRQPIRYQANMVVPGNCLKRLGGTREQVTATGQVLQIERAEGTGIQVESRFL